MSYESASKHVKSFLKAKEEKNILDSPFKPCHVLVNERNMSFLISAKTVFVHKCMYVRENKKRL